MKIFWNKYREAIVVAIYVLLLLALFYLVVKPLISSIDAKVEKIQGEAVNQERRARRLSELSKLRGQFENIQKEQSNIQVFISRDQIVTLIEELEKIAGETNNKIIIGAEDEKPKKSKEEKEKEKDTLIGSLPSDNYLKINILLSGSYNSTIDFIRKVENIRYWSEIVSMNISNRKLGFNTQRSGSSPFTTSNKNYEGDEFFKPGDINAVLEIVFYLGE